MHRENRLGWDPRLVPLFRRLVPFVHVHLLNVVRLFRQEKVVKIPTTSRTEQSSFATESIDLQFESILAGKLTLVANKTRHALNTAPTTRLYGRVWKSKYGDRSLFRDAGIPP